MKVLNRFWAMALVVFTFLSAPSSAQDLPASGAMDSTQAGQLESLLGREVRTQTEGDSGRIIDLLTDRNGKLQAAVVEMGGFLGIGTRKIAIDWRAFRFNTQDAKSFVTVEMDRERLRFAPEYTASQPVVVLMVNED